MPDPTSALPPLPRSWPRFLQTTILHVMSLAHYVLVTTRSWAANGANERLRLAARAEELEHEIAMLREEIRIKDARLARIPALRRPHYQPSQRLAILELRAVRGWSLAQTARIFQVTTATIASWSKRLDETGPTALLRTPGPPVNRFPDLVRYLVQRLQTLCPRLGKVKLAQLLARAGLHLGVSTVGRIRRERPAPLPAPAHPLESLPSARRVTARYPDHLWHVDLTTVPTSAGLWASWVPVGSAAVLALLLVVGGGPGSFLATGSRRGGFCQAADWRANQAFSRPGGGSRR